MDSIMIHGKIKSVEVGRLSASYCLSIKTDRIGLDIFFDDLAGVSEFADNLLRKVQCEEAAAICGFVSPDEKEALLAPLDPIKTVTLAGGQVS